jgi:D-alanyl-D-alanine carboxypeptidase
VTLKRFNTYSNNDLIRLAEPFGGATAVQEYLRRALDSDSAELELSTASGQGKNRMTARSVVALLRRFQAAAGDLGLKVEELLPIPGCDPGPTRQMFPRLVNGEYARVMVCKTGTLTTTDGGVIVLAGFIQSSRHGVVLFCVAAPGTGRKLTKWRSMEQEWLIDVIDRLGGATPFPCGPELPFSDTYAEVRAVDLQFNP